MVQNDPQILPYKVMYILAVIAALVFVIIEAIQAVNNSNPALGLTPTAIAWMDVTQKVITGLAFILPSLRQPPQAQRKGLD